MKVLFTADWHIKLGQKNVPVAWAVNRYYGLFSQIHELEKSVDMMVIGGDVFDKLPSMEELELFFDFIADVSVPTYIFSGNHEAKLKHTTFLSNLVKMCAKVNPLVVVIDTYCTVENMDFIPYNKLKIYNPADIDFHGDILFTHVRGEIPPHVKPEIPLELLDRWKVVYAGDLHSYENSQRNIFYPGSPVTTSFHRNLVDTGVIILDTERFTHEWVKLSLPQLIRKTIRAGEQMPEADYDHVIYEVEGDMAELSNLENHALLDKKVLKRDSDTTLILDNNLTLEQEVEEYLRFVLQLNEESINSVLKELSNHIGKLEE